MSAAQRPLCDPLPTDTAAAAQLVCEADCGELLARKTTESAPSYNNNRQKKFNLGGQTSFTFCEMLAHILPHEKNDDTFAGAIRCE